MHPFRRPFWAAPVLLATMLAGCGTSHESSPPKAASPPAAAGDEKEPPLRGTVQRSQEALVFHACGAVEGRDVSLKDPSGEVASVLSGADNPVYVELRGSPSADGATLTVSRIERAREQEGTACDHTIFAGDFEVRGEEPFFAVDILETGIVYRSPEEPKGVTYPYGVTPNATGRREYASKIEGPHASTLDIVLEPGRCLDAMSGEVYGYKAHVTRNDRKLEGCASAGVPPGGFGDAPLDELSRWLGTRPSPSMWTTPPLGARLDVLLGPKAASFRQNIEVRSALMKDGTVFYVIGNRPHGGGVDNAIFLAEPATDTINVILVTSGRREDLKEGDRTIEPPEEVKKALANLPTP